MEKIFIKEYKNFEDMHTNCANILKNIPPYIITPLSAIKYIRNNTNKKILNSFYSVGCISKKAKNKIDSKSFSVKLSMDSLIKNVIEHPEISIYEYLNIHKYILNAEYILLKNNKNLVYFKIENKIYQFVIKNTKNGCENFITTFHKASIKQLKKDLKRYRNII